MTSDKELSGSAHQVEVSSGSLRLPGDLSLPPNARGVVLFAHGSGSSRHSPRNQYVAQLLREAGLGTLLFDLLTPSEESADAHTGHLQFDISFLATRVVDAVDWLQKHPQTSALRIGCFGASTGAAAALLAAAERPELVHAVVSRGGRPDLAGPALGRVHAPTLLIVGGRDHQVLELNQQALVELPTPEKELLIIKGATHLFEEPGTLEEAARVAASWFVHHVAEPTQRVPSL